jgi:hypothetical protein
MQEILKVIRITKAKHVCEEDLLVKGTEKVYILFPNADSYLNILKKKN